MCIAGCCNQCLDGWTAKDLAKVATVIIFWSGNWRNKINEKLSRWLLSGDHLDGMLSKVVSGFVTAIVHCYPLGALSRHSLGSLTKLIAMGVVVQHNLWECTYLMLGSTPLNSVCVRCRQKPRSHWQQRTTTVKGVSALRAPHIPVLRALLSAFQWW